MITKPDTDWPDFRTRRALLYVTALCATVVIGLGLAVAGSHAAFGGSQEMRTYIWFIPVDGLPIDEIKAHPVARMLVILGEPFVFGASIVILTALALLNKDRRLAFISTAGPISAEILTEVIAKPWVGREAGIYYAYPSGHVTAVASIMAVFALLLRRSFNQRTALIAAPFIAAYTASSLAGVIILNMHDLIDAVGGLAMAIGVISLWCVVALEWNGSSKAP